MSTINITYAPISINWARTIASSYFSQQQLASNFPAVSMFWFIPVNTSSIAVHNLSFSLSLYSFIHPSMHPSIHPSIHLSIYRFVTTSYTSSTVWCHYSDVIMNATASQITGVIVYSTFCSGADKKTTTSKLRVTGLCEGKSPHKGPVT